MKARGHQYNLSEVVKMAEEVIKGDFTQVVQSKGFLELNINDVYEVMKHRQPKVSKVLTFEILHVILNTSEFLTKLGLSYFCCSFSYTKKLCLLQ